VDTGELKPEVWARWLEFDPMYMVDRYADNLKKLRLLLIDCGTRDEFNLHFGARLLVKKLKARRAPRTRRVRRRAYEYSVPICCITP
jgi:hypothetical protein